MTITVLVLDIYYVDIDLFSPALHGSLRNEIDQQYYTDLLFIAKITSHICEELHHYLMPEIIKHQFSIKLKQPCTECEYYNKMLKMIIQIKCNFCPQSCGRGRCCPRSNC